MVSGTLHLWGGTAATVNSVSMCRPAVNAPRMCRENCQNWYLPNSPRWLINSSRLLSTLAIFRSWQTSFICSRRFLALASDSDHFCRFQPSGHRISNFDFLPQFFPSSFFWQKFRKEKNARTSNSLISLIPTRRSLDAR